MPEAAPVSRRDQLADKALAAIRERHQGSAGAGGSVEAVAVIDPPSGPSRPVRSPNFGSRDALAESQATDADFRPAGAFIRAASAAGGAEPGTGSSGGGAGAFFRAAERAGGGDSAGTTPEAEGDKKESLKTRIWNFYKAHWQDIAAGSSIGFVVRTGARTALLASGAVGGPLAVMIGGAAGGAVTGAVRERLNQKGVYADSIAREARKAAEPTISEAELSKVKASWWEKAKSRPETEWGKIWKAAAVGAGVGFAGAFVGQGLAEWAQNWDWFRDHFGNGNWFSKKPESGGGKGAGTGGPSAPAESAPAAGSPAGGGAAATETPTATPTETATPGATATSTETPFPTATTTETPVPTATATSTATVTPTSTITPTATASPDATATVGPAATATPGAASPAPGPEAAGGGTAGGATGGGTIGGEHSAGTGGTAGAAAENNAAAAAADKTKAAAVEAAKAAQAREAVTKAAIDKAISEAPAKLQSGSNPWETSRQLLSKMVGHEIDSSDPRIFELTKALCQDSKISWPGGGVTGQGWPDARYLPTNYQLNYGEHVKDSLSHVLGGKVDAAAAATPAAPTAPVAETPPVSPAPASAPAQAATASLEGLSEAQKAAVAEAASNMHSVDEVMNQLQGQHLTPLETAEVKSHLVNVVQNTANWVAENKAGHLPVETNYLMARAQEMIVAHDMLNNNVNNFGTVNLEGPGYQYMTNQFNVAGGMLNNPDMPHADINSFRESLGLKAHYEAQTSKTFLESQTWLAKPDIKSIPAINGIGELTALNYDRIVSFWHTFKPTEAIPYHFDDISNLVDLAKSGNEEALKKLVSIYDIKAPEGEAGYLMWNQNNLPEGKGKELLDLLKSLDKYKVLIKAR